MRDIDPLIKVRRLIGGAFKSSILTALSVAGFAVVLTAAQLAFAAPSPP